MNEEIINAIRIFKLTVDALIKRRRRVLRGDVITSPIIIWLNEVHTQI